MCRLVVADPLAFDAVRVITIVPTTSVVFPSNKPVAEFKVTPEGKVPLLILYSKAGGKLSIR